MSCGFRTTDCTHIFLIKAVHLCQKLLLAVRVGGQEVGGKRKRVGDDLVASDEEDEGLAHDLVHSQWLGQAAGLVWPGGTRSAVGGGEHLSDHIKAVHPHRGGGMSGIQDQLEEISPPLRDKRRKCRFWPPSHMSEISWTRKWSFSKELELDGNQHPHCGVLGNGENLEAPTIPPIHSGSQTSVQQATDGDAATEEG